METDKHKSTWEARVAGGWKLAIDFGTSNTAAAHTSPRSGEVEPVALTHGGNLLPSAVYAEPSGAIAAGAAAANRAEGDASGFMPFPKRAIGSNTVRLRDREVAVIDLFAAVLHVAYRSACRKHGDVPPEKVVLTHPEAWDDSALLALKEASRRAGIDPDSLLFVSEPRAAATYYTTTSNLQPGERIGVFDFGGGTLDIAILEAVPGGDFRILAARGDNGIGGRNFDALIREWVFAQLDDSNPPLAEHLRSGASTSSLRALDLSVRAAKEVLSEEASATISVSTSAGNETLLLTRAEFNGLIDAEIQRAVELTWQAMSDGGVAHNGLRALYLTGGSSQVPLIHSRLSEFAPVATLDDPKTVVAQGALLGALRVEQMQSPAQSEDNNFAQHGFAPAPELDGSGPARPPQQGPQQAGPGPQNQGQNFSGPHQAAAPNAGTGNKKKSGGLSGGKLAAAIGAGVVAVAVAVGGTYFLTNGGFGGAESFVTDPVGEGPEGITAALPEALRNVTTCESKEQTAPSGKTVPGAKCMADNDAGALGEKSSYSFPAYVDEVAAISLVDEQRADAANPESRIKVTEMTSDSGDVVGFIQEGEGFLSLLVVNTANHLILDAFYPGDVGAAQTLWEAGGFAAM